ncbi:O-antigen ligase [Paenibacillus sp. R14(2021)]|uniref:O-antigen ligase family protein n=1 Tax=Paenibacillus sp. R14(2021) TaxID=2859228 RepID=UPI001C611E7B|nr:O-antigen ligase family protein [Paenibacillus sp. R14(2021)]
MKTKSKASKPPTDFSLNKWSGLAVLLLFLFAFPYSKGLFNGYILQYEKPLLEAELVVFVLLLFSCAYLFKVWKPDNWRAVLSAAIWLMPVTYIISTFHAASQHLAAFTTYTMFLLAALFNISLYYSDSKNARLALQYGILVSGYAVVIYGLANMMGQAYLPDALWYQQNVYRLTSVFQYPNAYAAYLSALFLIGVYLMATVKQWHWRFIHALMLVPIWVSFMLTLSRGALVIVPLLVLLIIPFLKLKNQLLFLLHSLIAVIISFAILGKISTVLDKVGHLVIPDEGSPPHLISPWTAPALSGWLWILAASWITAAIITWVHRLLDPWLELRLSRLSKLKWSFAAVPLLIIAVTVIGVTALLSSSAFRSILPDEIANRLETINFNQHSVLERKTFFDDAMKISADYPLFGAGGGGWRALYEQYQHNPYTSLQAHSYIFQTLVEVGWFGLLLILGIILLVYWIYIRNFFRDSDEQKSHFIFYIAATSILVHSFIDFDMSFIYLAAIVFISLGAMVSVYSQPFKLEPLNKLSSASWRFIYPSILAALSIVLLYETYFAYKANNDFRDALNLAENNKATLTELLPVLDKAIAASPSNPDYVLRKFYWLGEAYDQTQDKKYLDVMKPLIYNLAEKEPHNRDVVMSLYKLNKIEASADNILSTLEHGLVMYPWDIHFYETTIMEYYLAGKQAKEADHPSNAPNWSRAIELYNTVLDRQKQLKSLPKGQLQGRSFNLTALLRLGVGKIYYDQRQYKAAAAMLKPTTREDMQDSVVREASSYYLDALDALGKQDINLKEKLLKTDKKQEAFLNHLKRQRV